MGRAATLSDNIIDFCAWLRGEFRFLVGPAEERDALQAMAIVGVDELDRVRRALRVTLCSKPEELQVFDEAFDAFFVHPKRGVRQPLYSPRHSRQRPEPTETKTQAPSDKRTARTSSTALNDEEIGIGELRAIGAASADAQARHALRAHYSSQAGAAPPPAIAAQEVRKHLRAASDLIASVRLGRLRRWKPLPTGTRFDLRRTLRASLHTGGDPVALRFMGHPARNPHFVLLIDGSRSMTAHGSLMLEFAYALVQRSRRTQVFLFSTRLVDVTQQVRKAGREFEHHLYDAGEAWGGGTRIGESLAAFVHDHGCRCLDDETVTIIYSDGLDVGDARQLERAMHEIHRRSACVMWINPLVGTLGYSPTARGMRACLPFVDAFIGVRDAAELAGIARQAAAATR